MLVPLAIPALAAAALLAEGRTPICPCGRVRLWAGQVRSPENSQQVADWYSLSHVVHGLLFYAAGWLLLRRWPVRARLLLALTLEALWEVAENAPTTIARYRAVTVSWGYTGDSVLNSLGDMGFMAIGFGLAGRLPARASVVLAVALELVALAAIRDGLVLNLLMLIAPSSALRAWQAGG